VKYSKSIEAKRALDLGQIKFRKEKINFFSFLGQVKAEDRNKLEDTSSYNNHSDFNQDKKEGNDMSRNMSSVE